MLVMSGLLIGVAACTNPLGIGLPVSAKDAAAWYKEHRGDLVAVAQLARSGALGDPSGWDYYGPRLPKRYAYLSATGRIAAIPESEYLWVNGRNVANPGAANQPPVLFLATAVGIPDDAIGLAHLVSLPKRGATYDGFGMRIRPTRSLGDGWWWMDQLQTGRPS
jgi:hypothetical protein